MSGDGSGRRSEARGRSRDPHRDRPRSSRSRSRSPLSPGARRGGAAPERREAAERPSPDDAEPSDSGDELMDPASLEAEEDHGLCRQIRHQYRALINSVQRKAGGGRAGTGSGHRRAPGGQAPRAQGCLPTAPAPAPRRPAPCAILAGACAAGGHSPEPTHPGRAKCGTPQFPDPFFPCNWRFLARFGEGFDTDPPAPKKRALGLHPGSAELETLRLTPWEPAAGCWVVRPCLELIEGGFLG